MGWSADVAERPGRHHRACPPIGQALGDRVFSTVAYNVMTDRGDREGLNFEMTQRGGVRRSGSAGHRHGYRPDNGARSRTSIGCSLALLRPMIVAFGHSLGPRVAPGCAGKCAAGTRDICWIDAGMLRKGELQRFFCAEVIENPR